MIALPSLMAAFLLEPAAIVALFLGARRDVLSRTIPDEIGIVVAAAGLLLRFNSGDLPAALLGVAVMFALLFLLWSLGVLGGGDAKLMTACSLLVAPSRIPALLTAIAISGGVLGAAYLLLRRLGPIPPRAGSGRNQRSFVRLLRVETWRAQRGGGVPYGCAIAAGALAVVLNGWGN